ncbi:hypothetical protein Ciccas_012788, partial [Cichlidogyrus casuarinus]
MPSEALASYFISTRACKTVTSRRAAVVCNEAKYVNTGGAATGADLGGSSNYSSGTLEDRSGEGFHGNSAWPWYREEGTFIYLWPSGVKGNQVNIPGPATEFHHVEINICWHGTLSRLGASSRILCITNNNRESVAYPIGPIDPFNMVQSLEQEVSEKLPQGNLPASTRSGLGAE